MSNQISHHTLTPSTDIPLATLCVHLHTDASRCPVSATDRGHLCWTWVPWNILDSDDVDTVIKCSKYQRTFLDHYASQRGGDDIGTGAGMTLDVIRGKLDEDLSHRGITLRRVSTGCREALEQFHKEGRKAEDFRGYLICETADSSAGSDSQDTAPRTKLWRTASSRDDTVIRNRQTLNSMYEEAKKASKWEDDFHCLFVYAYETLEKDRRSDGENRFLGCGIMPVSHEVMEEMDWLEDPDALPPLQIGTEEVEEVVAVSSSAQARGGTTTGSNSRTSGNSRTSSYNLRSRQA